MSDVRGSAIAINIVPETAYKTPGANAETLAITRMGVQPSQQRQQSAVLTGFRGQARSTAGAKDVTGQVSTELAGDDLGVWLKYLIGTPVTTGANPYTHTYSIAASGASALPVGFTLEENYGSAIASASQFLRLLGCRIGSGTFTFNANGASTLQCDVKGADFAQSNTALDGTPQVLGHTNFEPAHLTVSIGSPAISICLAELSVTVNNDLDDGKFCISGGGVRDGLPEGFAIITGSITAFFDHEDVIDTVLSGADTEMTITLSKGDGLGSAGNESLVITIPDLVFDVTGPTVDGPRGLRISANFTAHRSGASEQAFTAVLKNALATVI